MKRENPYNTLVNEFESWFQNSGQKKTLPRSNRILLLEEEHLAWLNPGSSGKLTSVIFLETDCKKIDEERQ
jgi:hypothetical protein